MSADLLLGQGDTAQYLRAAYANRHGLIAGATGTGKTITLQVLAEAFSEIGVPVFAADVKGDLSGLSQPGVASPKLLERAAKNGLPGWSPSASPVVFWDVFGKFAHQSSLEPLKLLTGHPHHAVRWAAIQNLGRLSRAEALAALEAASHDPHPHIQRAARKTLGQVAPKTTV